MPVCVCPILSEEAETVTQALSKISLGDKCSQWASQIDRYGTPYTWAALG